jgi:hypothetical protein
MCAVGCTCRCWLLPLPPGGAKAFHVLAATVPADMKLSQALAAGTQLEQQQRCQLSASASCTARIPSCLPACMPVALSSGVCKTCAWLGVGRPSPSTRVTSSPGSFCQRTPPCCCWPRTALPHEACPSCGVRENRLHKARGGGGSRHGS